MSHANIGYCINGDPRAGGFGHTQPVFNPATGEATGHVALAEAAEVDAAVRGRERRVPGLGGHAAAAAPDS